MLFGGKMNGGTVDIADGATEVRVPMNREGKPSAMLIYRMERYGCCGNKQQNWRNIGRFKYAGRELIRK